MTHTAYESARAVADAVLFEGYVLYPYRAGSAKNQVRWQWGVLMPADAAAVDASERSGVHTELLVDGGAARVTLTVRFLQAQRRTVERAEAGGGFASVGTLDVGDASYTAWDEATTVERELPVPADGDSVVLEVPGGTEVEELRDGSGAVVGRLVRVREPLRVGVVVDVERPVSPYAVRVLSVTLDNRTPPPRVVPEGTDAGPDRPRWLRRALVATHVLARVEGGRFLSLLDPPHWASALAAARRQEGLFPVLGGPEGQQTVVIASPIILYDHATLAPQSESAFFDALEVDELLSLRTMTLSEAERREMRGTDPRTAALLDQVDAMPPELWDRLHGTVSYLDRMTGGAATDEPPLPAPGTPWWDPGSDASVDPAHDAVLVGTTPVRRGSRVILRPGVRRADAYDLFLAGRTATVAAVLFDVDQGSHLAVTLDDDPGSDLKDVHGRYLYFAPDEVEPLADGPRA